MGVAICLLPKGRWHVFAWFVLISALMTWGEAVREIIRRARGSGKLLAA